MGRLAGILFGIFLGGGFVFFGFHYHVVRTGEGHLFVKKQETAFTDAYVDIRRWNYEDWRSHELLKQGLIKKGRTDLLPRPSLMNPLRHILPNLDTSARDAVPDVERR